MIFFYYSLTILLLSIVSSAVCLSSYLVSKNKGFFYLSLLFAFYFLDVSLVFKNDFIHAGTIMQSLTHNSDVYTFPSPQDPRISSPIAAALLGAFLIESYWLYLIHKLQGFGIFIKRKPKKLAYVKIYAPAFIFLALSLLSLCIPHPPIQVFIYWTWRTLFVLAGYALLLYFAHKQPEQRKQLLRTRYLRIVLILIALTLLVPLENALVLFVLPHIASVSSWYFFPDRNFAENLLIISAAVFSLKRCLPVLRLRLPQELYLPISQGAPQSDKGVAPQVESTKEELGLRDTLSPLHAEMIKDYALRHKLTLRETEILQELLHQQSNQEIASRLQLAQSTVKLHVNHILKKTKHKNRAELIQGFWRHL